MIGLWWNDWSHWKKDSEPQVSHSEAVGGCKVAHKRCGGGSLVCLGPPCKIEGSGERSQLGKISWHAVLFIGGMWGAERRLSQEGMSRVIGPLKHDALSWLPGAAGQPPYLCERVRLLTSVWMHHFLFEWGGLRGPILMCVTSGYHCLLCLWTLLFLQPDTSSFVCSGD